MMEFNQCPNLLGASSASTYQAANALWIFTKIMEKRMFDFKLVHNSPSTLPSYQYP